MASNAFSTSGSTKAPGETAGPAPIKQAPVGGGGVRQQQTPSFAPASPQLDEFGRNPSALGVKNPYAAVGDSNQRKANAASMMPQAAPSAPQNTPYGQTGGGLMADPQAPQAPPFMPGPPQQADPPQGGGRMPPQQFPQQRGPMPYDPQGGIGAGAGQGQMPGVFRGGQDTAPQGGPMGPPPGFQQMMQQPGFMQWLMKMFSQQQGGQPQMQGAGPLPGQPPVQQAGPMTQGPPR